MPLKNIIGREAEIKILDSVWNSKEAEFLAIYGRRRVGKTHLIREYFSEREQVTYFEISGEKDGGLKDQLENFINVFSKTFFNGIALRRPESWKEAFALLTDQIEKNKSKKIIIFFDELPWLATPKSRMLQSIDYYWNRFWNKHSNLILIVCGSAASWMLDNLINAKGGLYNRITRTILLKPYSLYQVNHFLRHRGINLSPQQILSLYMVFGGIPYYLKQIEKGKSAAQIINKVCFQSDGLLYSEFDRLFKSLFEHSEDSLLIIKIIQSHRYGISRDELIKKTKFSSGGTLNKRLYELESSKLIQSYIPYGNKKKNIYYRVIDEYCHFYLSWIEPLKTKGIEGGKNYWQAKAKSPSALAWAGYVFKSICLKHIDQIRDALEIQTIATETGSWKHIPKKGNNESGAQIDLLFDREDGIITLCEIKYSEPPFVIDKDYAKKLINKIDVFSSFLKLKKQIFITIITVNGVKPTPWSEELIQAEITLEDLMKS